MSDSLQGHFLLAADHLKDPNFFQSVILMLEHTEETAMGLIVNRPMAIPLQEALGEVIGDKEGQSPIFCGGPVERTSMFIMHNCADLASADRTICEGIYVSGSSDSFDQLLQESEATERERLFRVYCGYSGWSAGQLEQEIDRGDWLSIPATSAQVFQSDPYELWEQCVQDLKVQHRILPHHVSDPEMN